MILTRLNALIHPACCLCDQLIHREVGPAARSVDGDGVSERAEQLEERQSERLGLEVPKRDVDSGERAEGQALASVAADSPEHRVPVPLDVERVLVDQQDFESMLDNLAYARAGLSDSESLDSFVGMQMDEEL